ncbi:hypothetical protein [Halostella litorea]|uniref:hypothetical protein n=1 Tax=Halostella litorea TaxID=2528831 RepID=UPI00192A48A0|nr:hypothetical protein [Halostella litorea]
MSVSGLCSICQTREAQARCDQCGTMVCAQHYDESLGYCADCAAEASSGGRTF